MKLPPAGLFALTMTLATPAASEGQSLGSPTDSLAEEFFGIVSIVEIDGETVLISDPRSRRVVFADFRSGTIRQAGRVGHGPGEYSGATRLFRLGGDSVLMIDGSRRWLVFRHGAVPDILPSTSPVVRLVGGYEVQANSLGQFLLRVPVARRNASPTVVGSDSSRLVLVRSHSLRADTVTSVIEAGRRVTVTQGPNGSVVTRNMRFPMAPREEALLFPDGWIAIARVNPYRVDWRSPAGVINRGTELPVELTKVTATDRRVVTDSYPPRPDGLPPAIDLSAFPEFVPPFLSGSLVAGRDGQLFIQRTVTGSSRVARYDIVDRGGKLRGSLELPPNERIISFGRRHVYTVVRDADDIERVRRYRHPTP